MLIQTHSPQALMSGASHLPQSLIENMLQVESELFLMRRNLSLSLGEEKSLRERVRKALFEQQEVTLDAAFIHRVQLAFEHFARASGVLPPPELAHLPILGTIRGQTRMWKKVLLALQRLCQSIAQRLGRPYSPASIP